jgi:transposase
LPSNLPINEQTFRRVEVLTGTPRRRRWSTAEKAAIVAESFAPGGVTSEIALRYGLHRNQLYMWRRALRPTVVANAGVPLPDFVPVIAEAHAVSATAMIEIVVGDAVLRVGPGVDLALLGKIIGIVKMAAL